MLSIKMTYIVIFFITCQLNCYLNNIIFIIDSGNISVCIFDIKYIIICKLRKKLCQFLYKKKQ